MKLRSVLLLFAIGSFGLLSGCGSTGVAILRIIQVSPGTGSIDAFVSNTQVASALTYSNATSYVQVADGSHTVELTKAGQDNTSLYKQVVAIYANTYLTIFAVNPSTSISELVLTDNNTQPDSGDFKLRIVQVSPGAGVVDVYVTAPSSSITNIPATFRNLSYQTAETYLQLTAGSYEVRFTNAGTKTVIADTAAFTPAVGDIDTVALADSPGGGAPYQAYDYVDAEWSNNTINPN
jgi:hypothetical protein